MKPVTLIGILVAAVLAGVTGYQLGKQYHAGAPLVPAAKAERKILYYRNPMGLPDTSPVPKQDSMGMDYVPVYEDDAEASNSVNISPERVQMLGVTTEAAAMHTMTHTVRATAVIQPDERKLYSIAPRFEGWVRKLHVNVTGQTVITGQALLEIYSPELQSTAREYRLAVDSGQQDLAQSALQRLRNWEITPEMMEHGSPDDKDVLVLRAPVNGVVLEKAAIEGARFAPGEVLFKLADLSSVWIQAEVAEQDQGQLRIGQRANVTVDAYPGETFAGKVSFIAPVLNSQTRTVQVRLELSNPHGRLRPAMYANVQFATQKSAAAVLSVPSSAVIDSGTRQIVLVQVAPGRFAPREVKPGQRAGDRVEVLEGIGEGERVVTRANFLIDAESNLKAAIGGFGEHDGKAPAADEASSEHAGHNETLPEQAQHAGHEGH